MRTTKKPKLVVNPLDLEKLKTISKSRTAPHREVLRSRILLQYMEGKGITAIARNLNTNRPGGTMHKQSHSIWGSHSLKRPSRPWRKAKDHR